MPDLLSPIVFQDKEKISHPLLAENVRYYTETVDKVIGFSITVRKGM
jgi:hypothetical protein